VGAACYSNSGYLVPFLEQSLPYKEWKIRPFDRVCLTGLNAFLKRIQRYVDSGTYAWLSALL
jgi:hypothetical protein